MSPSFKSSSFPTALSGFCLYRCVARNCVPERVINCLLSPSVSCYTSISITASLSSKELRPAVSFPFRFPSVELLSGVIAPSHFAPLLTVLPLDPCFFSFLFQSLSCDYPLHAFHHLPKILYFSNKTRHRPTPLTRESTSTPSYLPMSWYSLSCQTVPSCYNLHRPNACWL